MQTFSEKEAKDAGIAVSIIIASLAWYKEFYALFPVVIGLLAVCLFWPYLLRMIFVPLWWLMMNIVGPFFSNLLLIICFFCMITPIGFLRRVMGSDTLQLKKWKEKNNSAFTVREKIIQKNDMEKPY
jgi:hypothetical protein